MATPKKSDLKELFAYIREIGEQEFRANQTAKDLLAAWKAGSLNLTVDQMKDKIDAALSGKSVASAGAGVRVSQTSKELNKEAASLLKMAGQKRAKGSVSAQEAEVVSGGESFSRLKNVADDSEDSLPPDEKMMRDEAVQKFTWTDQQIQGKRETLRLATQRLGFGDEDPKDVLSRIDSFVKSQSQDKELKGAAKEAVDYWENQGKRLRRLIDTDSPEFAKAFTEKAPDTILDNYGLTGERLAKPAKGKVPILYSISSDKLWGGEPNFGEAVSSSASVPTMITANMKAKLKEMGVTDEEIFNMTPEQAHAKLGGSRPTVPGTVVNLDEAYKKAIRTAKSAGAPVTVKSIQEWTGVKSDQAAEIMARMDDEGFLGKATKKGGRYFVAPQVAETVATDAPAPVAVGGGTEKVVGNVAKPDAPKTVGSGWSKMLGRVATAEKEGLNEAASLLSKGKILKGLGRGLGTWSGAALAGILPSIAGSVARGALESNPWGESETSSQDREVARMAMDSGALMNRVRLQAEQKASAMQALMSNPQLQAALQKQIRGREMMRTGRLPGDVLIGGRPDEGPFDDPEGLMAMLQGR